MNHKKPGISIVTPSYNAANTIEETIRSILLQKDENLEYIIIDAGSTDKTLDIIKKFGDQISFWQSEHDGGMYDGINKGFLNTSGEIMAYLNADDKYHPNAFAIVAQIFNDIPEVNWLYGCPTTYDEVGRCVAVQNSTAWSKYRYYMGDIHTIQQENIFWRRSLWDKAGGYMNTDYKLAGDFELWLRFFRYEKLYLTDALIGGFRRFKPGQQLSSKKKEEYAKEVQRALKDEIISEQDQKIVSKIKKLNMLKRWLYHSRVFSLTGFHHEISNRIDKLHDFPPRIVFNFSTQKFELEK